MKNERFFGLHFDFHAVKDSPVGETTNAEDIKYYIEEVKPDYIQCDCKGHPGIACYPTRVGTASDNMVKDNLKIWVDTAHSCNIPIYMHYSGIVDEEYSKAHPEHTFNYAKDVKDIRTNVFDDAYVRELLIPQLKELIEDYDVDGVWIDGDGWPMSTTFTNVEGYITDTMKSYLREDMTRKEVDKALRDAYKVYLKTYVDELHAFKPDFKIISNWVYSSYMPEKCEIDVDFLSGDYYAPQASNGIRYEGRCMAAQGKPWDIMTWGFSQKPIAHKSEQQLCQEAASTLILGGGFEVYMMQNPDGSIRNLDITKFKNLGEFVRARKFNFGKKLVSQIGIFYSAQTRYENGECYNQRGSTKCLQGTLFALLDMGYTVDMVLEYRIDEISKYEMVVVPEWELMSDSVKEKLKSYAENGGKLLIIGKELTAQMTGCEISETERFIKDKTGSFMCVGNAAVLNGGENPLYKTFDLNSKTEENAYKTEPLKNGSITYIPFDSGSLYANGASYVLRNFLDDVVKSIIDKKVELNRKNIDVTLVEDDDGVILNLLNQNKNVLGMGEVFVYDEVPPVYELEVKVNGKFSAVTSLFDEPCSIEIFDDYVLIKINKLHIHTAFKLKCNLEDIKRCGVPR